MTLEERLARLERQNRWMKCGLALLLVVGVAAGLLGFSSQDAVPDVVKARAFHVVGKDGKLLVKLEDVGTGADVAGQVTTLNSKGQELVYLGSTTDGNGVVTTLNGKGQDLVQLTATRDGKGMVRTLNGKGQAIVRLGVMACGAGSVTTLNGKGREVVDLTTMKDGRGAVAIYDPSGVRGARILAP